MAGYSADEGVVKQIYLCSFAFDDWHTPYAENDLRVDGKFFTKLEAKDGGFGFELGGVYDELE